MSLADIAYINPTSILDLGANVGAFAFEAKKLWPKARMYLVEANNACSEQLSACCVWHRQYGAEMTYTIMAVGAEEGERTFYKRKGGSTDTGNSFYRELTPFFSDELIETETVHVYPLDEIAYEQFDLLKLDLQGAELDALRGGEKTLAGAKWVLMEVALTEYNQGAPLLPEVSEFMAARDFVVERVVEDICHPITREIVQQDILYRKL